jgi:hypothetical protein
MGRGLSPPKTKKREKKKKKKKKNEQLTEISIFGRSPKVGEKR